MPAFLKQYRVETGLLKKIFDLPLFPDPSPSAGLHAGPFHDYDHDYSAEQQLS